MTLVIVANHFPLHQKVINRISIPTPPQFATQPLPPTNDPSLRWLSPPLVPDQVFFIKNFTFFFIIFAWKVRNCRKVVENMFSIAFS